VTSQGRAGVGTRLKKSGSKVSSHRIQEEGRNARGVNEKRKKKRQYDQKSARGEVESVRWEENPARTAKGTGIEHQGQDDLTGKVSELQQRAGMRTRG